MISLTKKIRFFLGTLVLITTVLGLSSCSGGSSGVDSGLKLLVCELPLIPDPTGTSCVEQPPLECPAPTVPNASNDACVAGADPNAPQPSVFAGENQAILFYNRPQDATNVPGDPVYDGYRLHNWNNDACDSYATDSLAESWGNGLQFDGIDPNYGAYWILNLKEDHGDCANILIHIGTDDAGKEMGGGDFTMNLVQDDPVFTRMNWTLSGFPAVFEFPILSLGDLPLQIQDFAAHWIDANTLVWDVDPALITEVRLHHSSTAGIEANDDGVISGTTITLTPTTLTDEQKAAAPQVQDLSAFSGDWTAEEAKAILKNQLVLAAYNEEGAFLATSVQSALVLDDLYTKGEADADEATLGVIYDAGDITTNLWAPTAQSVKLNVYDADKNMVNSNTMVEDPATGIWSFTGDSSLDRQFYRFELAIFHQQNKQIETIESTDPYSYNLSTNGRFSQFVNLDDADLKPEGWDGHPVATIADPEDAVIYEGHIRDFSARDESVTEANRGKYMAFTEMTSRPVQHLINLAANGLTHFHILPVNDIASIDEDPALKVDINDTVADLCAINPDAPVCEDEDDNATLLSVLEGYPTFSNPSDAQALVQSMRGLDSFNWGYDPQHFSAPDGIYASDPDGIARVKEMRYMIKSLHDIGLRVVLDVVYNHTNSAGLFDNSVLDKVVPGYYHNRDIVTGNVIQSTCCNDTALEHRMMDKLMSDSLVNWSSQYGYDGYRFDIMSHGSKDQMLAAREAVRAVDPDTHFYGEGWFRQDGGRGFVNATQDNLAGTEISTFNDRLRDGVRGAELFNGDTDNLNAQDIVKLGMAGTLADYVLEGSGGSASTGSSFNPSAYAKDPADIINYVSKHDDNTLWDQLQFNFSNAKTLNERVRSQNIAAAIPLMSQGIPFLQMGGDMMRSKSMDRNSFDSGDWFNLVDFTMESNNWNVGLPLAQDNANRWEQIGSISSNPETQPAMSEILFANGVFNEFLNIRRDSKLFRLTTADDVIARVGFHNIGSRQQQGVIVMSIDDGLDFPDLDPASDALVVMINGTADEQNHTIPTASGFELIATQATSIDGTVQGASFVGGDGEGTFTVPAYTMAVFTKPQGEAQGAGLSAFATSGAPDVVPYGDTIVFLRGGMNGWGTDDPFVYKGNGIYQVAVPMTAGVEQEFKVASDDWSTVDLGASSEGDEQIVSEGVDKVLATGGSNLKFTAGVDVTYLFQIDATDTSAPVLNVINEEPFPGTTVFLRGSMNGWGTDTPFNYDGGRIYSVTTTLTAATHEFKVASEDWATVNLGAETNLVEDKTVELGVEKLLGQVDDNNLILTIDTEASYVFIFDMVDLIPKLKVFNQEFFAGTPVFLRGGMNDWGLDDELIFDGNGSYIVDIALTAQADPILFKVASEDWAAVNFGAENADSVVVELGVAKPLFITNDNLSLEVTADGTFRFTVTGPDGLAPKVTVEEVTP